MDIPYIWYNMGYIIWLMRHLPITRWAVRTHCDGVKAQTCKSCILTTPGTFISRLILSKSRDAGDPLY